MPFTWVHYDSTTWTVLRYQCSRKIDHYFILFCIYRHSIQVYLNLNKGLNHWSISLCVSSDNTERITIMQDYSRNIEAATSQPSTKPTRVLYYTLPQLFSTNLFPHSLLPHHNSRLSRKSQGCHFTKAFRRQISSYTSTLCTEEGAPKLQWNSTLAYKLNICIQSHSQYVWNIFPISSQNKCCPHDNILKYFSQVKLKRNKFTCNLRI